ncbi:hypothetical protein [Psychromonas sp. KJ10-2]|uniref:hypothetical protein n=1 Tax=Psychromonas sp. KJ10-2 TaxID=3391822 RepID=UPI0039B438A4
MQHFQSILIVIGILAIAGVLIHGFLLNRKNKQALKAEQQAQLDELAAQAREEEAEQEPVQANPKMSKLNRDYDSVAFSTNVDDQHDESDAFHFNVQQKRNQQLSQLLCQRLMIYRFKSISIWLMHLMTIQLLKLKQKKLHQYQKRLTSLFSMLSLKMAGS